MGNSYFKPEIKSHVYPELCIKIPSMKGKVVAITGTTSGTGFVAARTLASKDAKLILLNRSSEKAEGSFKYLKEQFPEAHIEQITCDLQDFNSVRSAGAEVRKSYPDGVNVLCLNAGVLALPDTATKDGYDVQIQTNHLSHFLLVKELYPVLKKSADNGEDTRVVIMTSVAREGRRLQEKYFGQNSGKLGGDSSNPLWGARWIRYQQSKLANAVFGYALKDKITKANVPIKVILAHPGNSATDLYEKPGETTGFFNVTGSFLASWFLRLGGQSEEDGASSILYSMCMPDVQSGDFYGPSRFGFYGPLHKIKPDSKLTDESQWQLLWRISEDAVGKFEIA